MKLTSIFALTILAFPLSLHAENTINAVIASVNGQAITLSDLRSRIKSSKQITLEDLSSNTGVRQSLDQIILEHLIQEEAKQRQLSVNQSDIDGYISDIASQNSLTIDQFKNELKKENIDFSDYQSKVKIDILKSKIASVVFREGAPVTEEEIDSYIKDHSELSKGGEKVKLRQILISKDGKSPEEIKQLTEEVELKVKNGDEFSDLAKAYSNSSNNSDGGLLGVMAISELSPLIQDSIILLDQGETSQAVETEQGIYFFFVEEKFTGKTDSIKVDVRRLLENQKTQEKLAKYFALDIYKKHSVEKKV